MNQPQVHDTEFEAGEAEALVQRIRHYLHSAQEQEVGGQQSQAQRNRQQAADLTKALAKRLEPRFEQNARAAFGSTSNDLFEEAIVEMLRRLHADILDLTSRKAIYERKFNLVVKLMMINAIRKVRADYPETKPKDKNSQDTFRLVSLERSNAPEGQPTLAERIEDTRSKSTFEAVLGDDLVRDLLSCLPNERWGEVMKEWLNGATFVEIAAQLHIDERTARNYHARALSFLKALLLSPRGRERFL